jgi:hypothetical protein
MIHYIGKEWNTKFIISKTICGIDWYNASDSSDNLQYVTCKKCLCKAHKQIEKQKIQDNIEDCLFDY